jgi:hypothetical protein
LATICAAKGVLFLVPLKPEVPEEAQQSVFPKISQIVTIVLLKVVLIFAIPISIDFFCFFFYFCHFSFLFFTCK